MAKLHPAIIVGGIVIGGGAALLTGAGALYVGYRLLRRSKAVRHAAGRVLSRRVLFAGETAHVTVPQLKIDQAVWSYAADPSGQWRARDLADVEEAAIANGAPADWLAKGWPTPIGPWGDIHKYGDAVIVDYRGPGPVSLQPGDLKASTPIESKLQKKPQPFFICRQTNPPRCFTFRTRDQQPTFVPGQSWF